MSHSKVTKKVVCMLALTVAAVAASPASAITRHHNPQKLTLHGKRIAKAAPTQIPILDGDLTRQSVSTQQAMVQIHAAEARLHSTGAGVTVAVLDGGFDLRHEALDGHILAYDLDMVDHDGDAQDLGNGIDDDGDGYTDWIVGHGTMVSSLILAVAPDVQILPIRVLDDEGYGTETSVVEGVNYAVAHGAKVINLSFVVPDATHALREALRAAANAGVMVVGAAGDAPDVWYDDPDLANRILTVGSVNATDALCPWSVSGILVDTYAPGEQIVGALGGAVMNSYCRWSGTSFSAPMVSGGAALLIQQNPAITPTMIATRIKSTTDPILGLPTGGRVNLGRALQQ